MKNKSGNHKSTNRFKFVTFTERVNSIDIRKSALYRIEHVNADKPEENETYFHNALIRWKVLNLTTEYINFSKKIEDIVTLPQLLHRKEEVVSLLLEHLSQANLLTLQPLLELVVVLAKDLQEDFYVYFPKFLDCLVILLNTKDPEQLEWTLICIAFLFKALKSYLKRDITVVFKSILPLLSNSTKWYIRNFAAESFAFIARDVKDKKKFLEKLVKIVLSNDDAINGCGHLLFEVIHGVGNQFHSCSSIFISLYLEAFKDTSINRKILFEILTQSIGDMLDTINPKLSDTFWSTVIQSVTSLFDIQKINGKSVWKFTSDEESLEYILKLIGQTLEHGQGRFLTNPLPIINLISNLLNSELSENMYKIIAQIGILILLCSHINLPHENSVLFVKKLISIPYPKIVTEFVQEVVSCSSFDMIVFPHFLESISTFDSDIIKALGKICIKKSPLCKNGSDIYTWVKYPIDLGLKSNSCFNFLMQAINQNTSDMLQSPDNCMNALICLPHIKNVDSIELKTVLKTLISNLISHLKDLPEDSENIDAIKNVLFFLAVSVESAIHLLNPENVDEVCHTKELMDALSPFLSNHRFICSLRILDVILTIKESEHLLDFEILQELHKILEVNLLSSYHEVRFLTTHIYSLFETIMHDFLQPIHKKDLKKSNKKLPQADSNTPNKIESFKVFSLCHSVESLPLSVETYREQLLKLSKVSFDSMQYKFIKDTEYKYFPLKFILGFMNVNFKLLWEPLENLILSFANGLEMNDFWEIFHPCLQNSVTNVRKEVENVNEGSGFQGNTEILISIFSDYFILNDKPDYALYRMHLLEVLCQAPTICEAKNKDITTIFLDFMKVEFNRPQAIDIYDTSMCVEGEDNVSKEIEENKEVEENKETEEDKEIEEDKEFEEDDVEDKSPLNKLTYDAFIAHLKIYACIQNPKSFYKEQNLLAIYSEFLMHKNPLIQKVALDCIMKYKNKHITPYKDQLYNLIDGKKFKGELRTFKLGSDSDCIRADDRDVLMPVVLRIAFSKMITNTGIDKKGGSQMRRSLVMRFLSGCTENELIIFTDMAFQVFIDYINLDIHSLYQKMKDSYKTLTTLAPKRLLGCLNLVDNMREQFVKPGESQLLSKLLRVVFCIGSFIKSVLEGEENLRPGYSSILKTIRSNCIVCVGNFFKQLDQWTWSETEITSVFEIFVWPIIDKLPVEGIHSPTALLKLFNVWSIQPRYHIFFHICKDDKTVLPYLLDLLSSEKLNYSVNDMCLLIIERLLTLEYTDENIIRVSQDSLTLIDNETIANLDLKENLNIGTQILVSQIPKLVPILKTKFSSMNPKKLQKRDITILSRVTEIVNDPQSVDTLLQFSLPILLQRIKSSDQEENLEMSIEALTKLLSKTSSPKQHILFIIPLFSKVTTARARKLLCESMKTLASYCDAEAVESLSITAEIITEMNATDEKWIEQPDFERRLAVYKKIHRMFEEGLINVELASLIVHNCFFTIGHSNDLALRSSASDCLFKIVPKLITQFKDVDFFINDTILNLIRNGLKSENENLKIETVSYLGELVRECSDDIPIFKELYPLTNKVDKEVDFFENLQHLQVHRKTRALLKFCNHSRTLQKAPSPKILMQFILPLASQYICNEKYVEKYTLVEAALETVSVICRLLPWHHYEIILKYYLNKLHSSTDHQKQLIKLISFILDSFHFDLSKAGNVAQLSTNIKAIVHKKMKDEKNEDMEVDDVLKQGDVEMKEIITHEDAEMKEIAVQEDIEMKEIENQNTDIVAFERIQVLSPSAAKRVIFVITSDILGKLNWSSSQVTEHETLHKSLRKDSNTKREYDEKLRIPMGFAIVKLLQKLPQPMLDDNILSIFIKIINFLKSPLINVRASARDIIAKIMLTVGSKYFNMLLNHLSTMLTRGIHVHILISTVHTLLETLQGKFSRGEMDKYLDNVLKICLNDLFGHASEEKEVVKIGNKAPEAKPSNKSFLTLKIIGQNISSKCIVNLLAPFKKVIENTHSKRTVLKVETCFQHISAGLSTNENISIESALIFLCGVFSESVPKLSTVKKPKPEPIYLEEKRPEISDCYIIPADPKGSKKMPKKKQALMSSHANAHVIIEFGLNLLHIILQKDKMNSLDCRPYLDPMIPYILDALKNPQVRISTLAIKCIMALWVKRIILPTLKSKIEDAVKSIFAILHKYATSGLNKRDENFHLVANSFKAVTALIKNVHYYSLNIEQTKTLLMYAEHDIHDFEKQATAFALLRAIISAKYDLVEIKDIMKKITQITVTSESPRAREESSHVLMSYLLNYSTPKIIKQNVEFYVKQLEYEIEHGRIAAAKILLSMIESFPQDTLIAHSSFIYISCGMRLVNESFEDCKKHVVICIDRLLEKVTTIKKNELFNLTLVMFSDNKPTHNEMAAQLLIRLSKVEGETFKKRLDILLPKISEKLYGNDVSVGRFVKVSIDNEQQESKDYSYIEILNLLSQICQNCPSIFTDKTYQEVINEIGVSCQQLLAYSHSHVRLGAANYLTHYFESLEKNKLSASIRGEAEVSGQFCHNVESLKSLILDLCSQLIPGGVAKDLCNSVCKCITVLLSLVSNFALTKNQNEDEIDNNYIDCVWIVKKVKSAINSEVAKSPNCSIVRFAVFDMLAELAKSLDDENILSITRILMSCVLREISSTNAYVEDLKNRANEVGTILNNRLGSVVYNDVISKALSKLVHKRKERKLKIVQDKVNNPERAAKRKLALKDKKREYKKRKVDKIRGKIPNRKTKPVAVPMDEF